MPVDPAFAELLADKRSELRAPPMHVTAEVMRAGNKAYLVTAPKSPIHAVEDRLVPGPAGALGVRIYRPTDAPRLPVIVFCHGGTALDRGERAGTRRRWRTTRAVR